MQYLNLDPEAIFLCSFDISSRFTNIPLKEIIQVVADTLYNSKLTPPVIPKALITVILTASTTSVEFSFNNTMHKKIGGVSMWPPLGPAMPKYLSGITRGNSFDELENLCFRYAEDTFSIFNEKSGGDSFLVAVNSLHPCLTVIF